MYLNHTIGRRKTSSCRLFIKEGTGKIEVNKKNITDYFNLNYLIIKVKTPLTKLELEDKYDLKITVKGGGINSQAEAIRLAISRSLVKINEEYKPILKEDSLLTRDPRMVERKKPGRKKARKSFQFSKR